MDEVAHCLHNLFGCYLAEVPHAYRQLFETLRPMIICKRLNNANVTKVWHHKVAYAMNQNRPGIIAVEDSPTRFPVVWFMRRRTNPHLPPAEPVHHMSYSFGIRQTLPLNRINFKRSPIPQTHNTWTLRRISGLKHTITMPYKCLVPLVFLEQELEQNMYHCTFSYVRKSFLLCEPRHFYIPGHSHASQ